ncbi:hypothetical protein ACTXT7_013710 [Hymenolepis weldensis]
MVSSSQFHHSGEAKPFPSSTSNQGPQARWSTTRGGVSHTAFQPQPPPLTTSTGTRHIFSTQQRHHQQQQTPPSSLKINTTPYDRRVVSMVPPPPPPPLLHATVLMPPITTTASQESAFTNLLYDMSCNVVPSQLPQSAAANLTSEFSGLSLTPRSVPRTNPHAAAVAGTMPRLSSSSTVTPKPEFSQPPPPPKVPAKMLRNGNGTTVLNASAVISSSSPDTEITTNSPSANSESYSGDTESEEKEPFSKETIALGGVIQPTVTNNDASLYAKEDIFEQHPFRPAAVMPVDEYTFTVPRQPASHLQQQQAFFQAQQQCLAADPSAALNDNASNWMGYHLQLNSQLQPSVQNTEGDQAPPTPPPRLASAMNTMQFTKASRNVPLENSTWQFYHESSACVDLPIHEKVRIDASRNPARLLDLDQFSLPFNFEAAQSSGFLVRNHPFRQPLKQASYTNPALNTVNCAEDCQSDAVKADLSNLRLQLLRPRWKITFAEFYELC